MRTSLGRPPRGGKDHVPEECSHERNPGEPAETALGRARKTCWRTALQANGVVVVWHSPPPKTHNQKLKCDDKMREHCKQLYISSNQLFIICSDENVLKLDCDNGCTTFGNVGFQKKIIKFVHLKWVNLMVNYISIELSKLYISKHLSM